MRLGPTPRPQRLSRSSLIILLYGALAALALTIGFWQGRPSLYYWPGSSRGSLLLGPALGLGFGLVVVFLSRWAVHRFEWARVLHHEFHSVVHELEPREIWLLAAASSVAEELFFRGALQPQFGLWASSALFAALHVRPAPRFLPWTLMSFIVGLVLGLFYQGLGDLGGPIAAHFTINVLNLGHIARTKLEA